MLIQPNKKVAEEKSWKWCWILSPPPPTHPRKRGVGDGGWAHKSQTPQCWQLPMSPLNSDPTASFTRKHTPRTPHTRWRTRRVPKLAKSDIHLPLHIYCYAVRTSSDVSLTHTEEFLRAKSLYSPVSHSSGPLSLLMVCRGWGGGEASREPVAFFFLTVRLCWTWTFFYINPAQVPVLYILWPHNHYESSQCGCARCLTGYLLQLSHSKFMLMALGPEPFRCSQFFLNMSILLATQVVKWFTLNPNLRFRLQRLFSCKAVQQSSRKRHFNKNLKKSKRSSVFIYFLSLIHRVSSLKSHSVLSTEYLRMHWKLSGILFAFYFEDSQLQNQKLKFKNSNNINSCRSKFDSQPQTPKYEAQSSAETGGNAGRANNSRSSQTNIWPHWSHDQSRTFVSVRLIWQAIAL